MIIKYKPLAAIIISVIFLCGCVATITPEHAVKVNNSTPATLESMDSEPVRINFLDVGQGDAALIDFPNGEQMLVDCGINARILPELGKVMKQGDREVNYLVVTHPDMDHYGGCADVLERFKVGHIYFTGVKKSDKYWQYFWYLAHKEVDYTQVDSEREIDIGDAKIDFLYPDHDVTINKNIPGEEKNTTDNDTSIVFKLSFGFSAALFTGDAPAKLEKYLISADGDMLESKVLKVGHHGSAGSSSQEFLDKVSPAVAIISVGENKYKHPSSRIIKRLERVGAEMLRTDEKGGIVLEMFQDGNIELK